MAEEQVAPLPVQGGGHVDLARAAAGVGEGEVARVDAVVDAVGAAPAREREGENHEWTRMNTNSFPCSAQGRRVPFVCIRVHSWFSLSYQVVLSRLRPRGALATDHCSLLNGGQSSGRRRSVRCSAWLCGRHGTARPTFAPRPQCRIPRKSTCFCPGGKAVRTPLNPSQP